jgi:hypothetical protein
MNIYTHFKIAVLSFLMLAFVSSSAFAGDIDRHQKIKPHLKEAEKLLAKRNKLFSLDFDVKLGASISNTNFEMNVPNDTLSNTTSKVGPLFGANLAVNFFGFGFSSGVEYGAKGFKSSDGETNNLNYFNIPLLIYFDFNVGEKVRVEGNLGPYFGLLLNQTNDPRYKVKNFDLGLTGNLQLAYMFNKYMGVLLGGKYEYGGLNNLGNNENIKRITTSTINIYTGLKFEL